MTDQPKEDAADRAASRIAAYCDLSGSQQEEVACVVRKERADAWQKGAERAARWHETRAAIARHRHANGDTLTAVEPASWISIALNHEAHAVALRALPIPGGEHE